MPTHPLRLVYKKTSIIFRISLAFLVWSLTVVLPIWSITQFQFENFFATNLWILISATAFFIIHLINLIPLLFWELSIVDNAIHLKKMFGTEQIAFSALTEVELTYHKSLTAIADLHFYEKNIKRFSVDATLDGAEAVVQAIMSADHHIKNVGMIPQKLTQVTPVTRVKPTAQTGYKYTTNVFLGQIFFSGIAGATMLLFSEFALPTFLRGATTASQVLSGYFRFYLITLIVTAACILMMFVTNLVVYRLLKKRESYQKKHLVIAIIGVGYCLLALLLISDENMIGRMLHSREDLIAIETNTLEETTAVFGHDWDNFSPRALGNVYPLSGMRPLYIWTFDSIAYFFPEAYHPLHLQAFGREIDGQTRGFSTMVIHYTPHFRVVAEAFVALP